MSRIALIAGSMAYLTFSTAVLAAPLVVPGSADAGRMLESLQSTSEPTLTAPQVMVSPQVGVQTPSGAQHALFLLEDVSVEGSTVYDNRELAGVFHPYLHQYLSVRKLYELAAGITKRYHDDGYVLSKAVVPPQDLTDGRVKIEVVEGYIDQVQTQGMRLQAKEADDIIGRIKGYRPLRIGDFERDILLLNDLAGVTARAVFTPADHTGSVKPPPGATGLILVFNESPVPTSISTDNYGSRFTGPYQMQFRTGVNHLLGPYQQTTISGLMALPQPNELQTVQLSHRLTLDGQGTTATLQAGFTHTEPGYTLSSSEIVSAAYEYGVSIAHPLMRSRTDNLYLSSDLVIKDITTDALDTRLYHDKLTIVSVGVNADNIDRWGGANTAQAKVSQGLELLGASPTGSPDLSRADGHSDFTRLSVTVNRLQAVTGQLRVYAAATGQYAWSPLLSSEQFGYGGQQFGRAFDPSELTGDNGMAGVVELRYSPPILIPHTTSELYTFYDIGRVWNFNDAENMQGGSSVGVGWRFAWGPHLSANLSIAQPLTISASAPGNGNEKGPRGFFSVNLTY